MNQSVLFNDQFDVNPQGIYFNAQQQGMQIVCFIGFETLSKLADRAVDVKNAATIYEEYRFDIEELAEQAIDHEYYQDDGSIKL